VCLFTALLLGAWFFIAHIPLLFVVLLAGAGVSPVFSETPAIHDYNIANLHIDKCCRVPIDVFTSASRVADYRDIDPSVRLELEGKENKYTHHNPGVACSTVPPTLTKGA
jgi:hypothetical protein